MASINESRKRKIKDANRGITDKTKVIRRYQDTYLNYGFTFVEKQGISQPLCVICGDILAIEEMVPSKLQRQLHTKHKTCTGKKLDIF